jgi:hypothetical protein
MIVHLISEGNRVIHNSAEFHGNPSIKYLKGIKAWN